MAKRANRESAGFLYVGIRGSVVAVAKDTGEVAWLHRLRKGSGFVPIVREGPHLYAVSGGEVTCLDARTGEPVWHNPLKGLGTGYATLAGAEPPVQAIAAEQAARAAAAAAAS